MTLTPITPYSRNFDSPSRGYEKYGFKGGSRDVPKQYQGHLRRERKTGGTYQQPKTWGNWDLVLSNSPVWSRVESRLQAKIVGTLGDRAEVGTALVEILSTLDLVRKNVLRLVFAAYALRKGAFKQFLEVLNVDPLPKHKHWSKTSPKVASSLWIEYWFGIAPTVNDIQTAVAILDGPSLGGWRKFEVRAFAPWTDEQSSTLSRPAYSITCKCFGKSGGLVRLVNPNLALAQQLGILNPLEVIVNVTPWSWLLGWFVNLQQWVSSFSAYAGYEFRDVYTTQYAVFSGTKRWQFSSSWATYDVQGYWMSRQLRLPEVKLHFKSFNLSLTRAATAISLLTLRLKSL